MIFKKKEEIKKAYGENIIQVRNVNKNFDVATQTVKVLKDISFNVLEGDFVMIYGPSGCGKSTLLHIINGWEEPTSGEILIEGKNLYFKSEDERAKMCHETITIVNQSAYWVKSLSVLENIEIPYLLSGHSKMEAKNRAVKLISLLGLEAFWNYRPVDLSSGQQGRINLLRSLINNPKIIMADEPTGNLDTKSSELMMDLFAKINSQLNRTIIMVTHDLDLLKYATKTVHILDGKVENLKVVDKKMKAAKATGEIFDLRDLNTNFEDRVEIG